jgi:hypothetical protein
VITAPRWAWAFRLLADGGLAGSTVRGAVRIWCGPLLIGEVSLAINVRSADAADDQSVADRASRYRKIFPSYSHLDLAIVEGFEDAARALGDTFLRDVLTLRAGERWQPRLLELIQEADVFQLFWSSNSMRSQYCQQEWEHALALRRPAFVRPLYWEDPLPEDMMLGLPPPALRELHFVKVRSSRLLPPPAPEPSESSRHGALDFGPDHLTTGAWPRPEQDETGVSHLGARPRPRDFLPRGPDPYPGLVVQVEGSSHALLTGSLYRVGRDPRSDIVLTDPRVSWAYAVLRAEGGTWFIEDLGSTNGTFVGSQRISRYRITQDCTLLPGAPALRHPRPQDARRYIGQSS